tara:strand:- start:11293 stop:13209 length:1917 start_codon:yes stop_codon:yes gene_type:complete
MSKLLVYYRTKGGICNYTEFRSSIKTLKIRKKIRKIFFKDKNQSNCLVGKLENFNHEEERLKINNLILDSLYLEIIGNIYNYDELKQLIKTKYNLLGQAPEEEIIGMGYKLFGYGFFEKINGEFSIIIFDKIKKKLICVRDRFGTNLIFFTKFKNNLVLSSEIKAILKFKDVKKKPNWKKLKTFLFKNYRYSFGDQSTFFKNIYLIPPNSINIWTSKEYKKKILWNYKIKDKSKISLPKAKKIFLKLLEKSFKYREDNINENRKAFLVSGGLDSPTIATLACLRGNEKKIGYSICYNYKKNKNELYYDESSLIKKIIKKNKMEWRPIYITSKDVKLSIDEILDRHDEPISTPTWVSHYILAKKISKDGIKFLFGGDGGDHALAGIYDDFPYYFADLFKANKTTKLNKELKYWKLKHNHPIFKKNRKMWEVYKKKCFDFKKSGTILDFSWDEEKMRNFKTYENLQGKFFKNINYLNLKFPSVSKSYLKSKLWQDLVYTSSPPSSRSEAINFGSFNINLRSIFLDKNFMEFCWSLPGEIMIKNGNAKYLMRYAMRDKLPKNVLMNNKHVGLNSPANIWFRGFLKKRLISSIEFLTNSKYQLLDKEKSKLLLNNHFINKDDNMMILWKFYSVASWIKKWRF